MRRSVLKEIMGLVRGEFHSGVLDLDDVHEIADFLYGKAGYDSDWTSPWEIEIELIGYEQWSQIDGNEPNLTIGEAADYFGMDQLSDELKGKRVRRREYGSGDAFLWSSKQVAVSSCDKAEF